MTADEHNWFAQAFETLKTEVVDHISAETAHLHKRLDVAHDKLNTALVAVSHLIRRDANMPDHAQILADLKAFDAELDAKVDAAVTEFDSFVTTHTAVTESLDDIAEIVAGLPAKAAKLDAIKEPVASGAQPSGADAGTSTAVDHVTEVGTTATTATTSDGATTTVDHASGSASTVDASGTPVATDDAAAQAARDAAAQAGVSIPNV